MGQDKSVQIYTLPSQSVDEFDLGKVKPAPTPLRTMTQFTPSQPLTQKEPISPKFDDRAYAEDNRLPPIATDGESTLSMPGPAMLKFKYQPGGKPR